MTIEWNTPGAMSACDCYYDAYYIEIVPLSDLCFGDDKPNGWRWEIRLDNEWLNVEPLEYGFARTLDEAKNQATNSVCF